MSLLWPHLYLAASAKACSTSKADSQVPGLDTDLCLSWWFHSLRSPSALGRGTGLQEPLPRLLLLPLGWVQALCVCPSSAEETSPGTCRGT